MSRVINFFNQIGFDDIQANAIINLLKISKNLENKVFFQDLEMLKNHFDSVENRDDQRKFKEVVRNDESENDLEIDLETFFENEIFSDKNIRDYLIFATQKLFGRERFEERNMITQKTWFQENTDIIYENLTNLEMTKSDKSSLKDPDYSFIFGASFGRIYLRCKSLIDEIVSLKIGKEGNKIYLVCGARALGVVELTDEITQEKTYKLSDKSIDLGSVTKGQTNELLLQEFLKSKQFFEYAQNSVNELNAAKQSETFGTAKEIKTQRLKGEQVIGQFIVEKILQESKTKIEVLEDEMVADGKIRGDTRTNSERILEKISQDSEDKSRETKILLVFNNPHNERMYLDFVNTAKINSNKNDLNLDVSYMGDGYEKPTMAAISEVAILIQSKFKNFLIKEKIGEEVLLGSSEFEEIVKDLRYNNHKKMHEDYKKTKQTSALAISPNSSPEHPGSSQKSKVNSSKLPHL